MPNILYCFYMHVLQFPVMHHRFLLLPVYNIIQKKINVVRLAIGRPPLVQYCLTHMCIYMSIGQVGVHAMSSTGGGV